MTKTGLVCMVAMIVLGIYDAIAVSIGGVPNSISRWMSDMSFSSPCFVMMFGYTAGHLFSYMRPSLRVALRPAVAEIPPGYRVTITAFRDYLRMDLVDAHPIGTDEIILSQSLDTADIDAMVVFAKKHAANPDS
jgi:hypothetical protein